MGTITYTELRKLTRQKKNFQGELLSVVPVHPSLIVTNNPQDFPRFNNRNQRRIAKYEQVHLLSMQEEREW